MAKIKTLKDRETAREKLSVFFGSNDNYHHPIRESVANSRDILQGSQNGKIDVILDDDCKRVTIIDNGSGIPMDGETDGVPNYELLFLTLFSGTKMEAGEDSTGTNGCGNTVINYTSNYMDITSNREGKKYHISFHNSGEILEPFETLGSTQETGTKITFELDDKIYTNTIFDPKEVADIVHRIVVTSPNITSTFKHKNIFETYNHPSLIQYTSSVFMNSQIDNITIPYKTLDTQYIDTKGVEQTETTGIEIILNYCNDIVQESYLNGTYLKNKGMIHDGIIEGLKYVIDKFCTVNGLYNKNEKKISKATIEDSISYVCNTSSTNVSFENQTKFSTQKKLYKEIAKDYTKEFFEHYVIENRDNMIELCKKILISKRATEKAEKTRTEARKQLEEKADSMGKRPEKFVPCRSKNPKEIELILIEGDSAKNPIKSSRNAYNQCIYPLKGKPINGIKNDIDSLLKNQEVKDIFQILGCGIEYKGKPVKGMPHFNIDNLQVDKILITTDRDTDGLHIESLLISIFYMLAPELIKQGKIYILMTPLYIIKQNKNVIYAYTEDERNNIIKSFNGKPFTEVRYKGLGGLNSVDLALTSMNPEKRVMMQYTWEDAEKNIDMIEMCLSDDKDKSLQRKLYIEKHGHKYFDYSLIEG